MQNNKTKMKDIIIAGDFNSNTIWDKWDRWWNHSDCVNELKEQNIVSVYHNVSGIEQGNEKQKTFFLHRNGEKGYYIDYVFAERSLVSRTKNFKIYDFKEWREYSDHVPVEWEYEE